MLKKLCRVPALVVVLFIGMWGHAAEPTVYPFDLRKTIDWEHCPHYGRRSAAEGYLAKYGELRMRHLAQFKEIGAVEPIVVLEAYGNTGRHSVYMLAGKTLYRVSWWFMFKDQQEEKNEVKAYPVNDVFVSLVEEGIWSLQKDFKGWEDCGTVYSTSGGFVLFSYKVGGVYRTTVCDTIISIEDVWGLERYRNLFTLLTGKFNVE